MELCPDLGMEVLHNRYLLKNADGHVVETPAQMYWRVANFVAQAESIYGTPEQVVSLLTEVFYKLMAQGKFLPNSPTLMNAARKNCLLSACFVLPVNDSISEIFEAVKNTAQIQKSGGGTGFALDRLRPTGDIVSSSGGHTSGPISFWKVLAEATNAIQQGAHRRGANMGMMGIDHPDILKFINAKQDVAAFNNFNISVKVTDYFMRKLEHAPDTVHIVVNPRTKQQYTIPKAIEVSPYRIQDLISADSNDKNCYSVSDIWQIIVKNAHATGEPGICFIDGVNQDNPTPILGKIDATNPCGEQPLLDYEACNLGSLNISKFVLPDGSGINWDELADATDYAVRFLDNVIDLNHWPIEQIRQISLGNRKIGLGVMGFADALILLGIRYDSDRAVDLAGKLSRFINDKAHDESHELAQKRGCFPNWHGSIWDTKYNRPMRNATCTTIAPTGSISIINKCSSGIEPVFNLAYSRRALDGQAFIYVHPLIETLAAKQGWMNDKVKTKLLAGEHIKNIEGVPERLADILVTAHQIDPKWHVRVQAAFQENVDNAVSKTVNLPKEATVEEVDRIFRFAYELRCKGCTVYRDSSRDKQVLSALAPIDSVKKVSLSLRPRAKVTAGKTCKFRTGCGTLFVTVNKDEEGISEVFANLGKAGGCPSQSEATCRAVSVALRSGVAPGVLVDQLSGIRCFSAILAHKSNKSVDVLSCPDAIARALKGALDSAEHPITLPRQKQCPECGTVLRKESGCWVCSNCFYTKCG